MITDNWFGENTHKMERAVLFFFCFCKCARWWSHRLREESKQVVCVRSPGNLYVQLLLFCTITHVVIIHTFGEEIELLGVFFSRLTCLIPCSERLLYFIFGLHVKFFTAFPLCNLHSVGTQQVILCGETLQVEAANFFYLKYSNRTRWKFEGNCYLQFTI